MASKFFLRATAEAVGISPTPASVWEDTTSMARCQLRLTSSGDPITTITITETSSTDKDVCARQYIAPLKAGQTITASQAVQFVARFTETTSGNNMVSAFVIRVMANDGTTQRKLVLGLQRDGLEFDVGTPGTLESRNNTGTSTVGDYTTVAGDYLVIEIGAGGDPATTNPHTYNISLGDDAAGFLDASDIDTGADNPWVQMADTLILEYSLEMPHIGPTSSLTAPELAYAVTLPHISATQLFEMTVDQVTTLNLPHIGPTASLTAPTVAYEVNLPTIAGTVVNAPSLAYAITLPTIPSGAVVNAPTLAYQMTLPHIGPTVSLFAPTLTFAVTLPHIGPTASLNVPTLAYAVTLPHIGPTAQLFAPAVAGTDSLSLPHISNTQLFAPTLTYSVELPHLGPTASLFAPSLAYAVTLPHISGTVLNSPTVTQGQLIELPFISGTQLFAPSLVQIAAQPMAIFTGSVSLRAILSDTVAVRPSLSKVIRINDIK